MKTIQDILDSLRDVNLEQYKEVMEYCFKRVSADEGIPTVIGLDDLTSPYNGAYQGASKEGDFNLLMAAGAMIFTSLYEKLPPEKLGHYPPIAPAMSAMTEMFFHPDEEGNAVQYREVVMDFIKDKLQ